MADSSRVSVQATIPPILIGVLLGGPRMNRLVSQYAKEWNCWIVGNSKIEVYREARDAVMQACDKHSRDLNPLRKNATIAVGSDHGVRRCTS